MTPKRAIEVLDSLFNSNLNPDTEELKEAIEVSKEVLRNSLAPAPKFNEEKFIKDLFKDMNDMYKNQSNKYLFTADFLNAARKRYVNKK